MKFPHLLSQPHSSVHLCDVTADFGQCLRKTGLLYPPPYPRGSWTALNNLNKRCVITFVVGTLLQKRILFWMNILFLITHPYGVSQIQNNCIQINLWHYFFQSWPKNCFILWNNYKIWIKICNFYFKKNSILSHFQFQKYF